MRITASIARIVLMIDSLIGSLRLDASQSNEPKSNEAIPSLFISDPALCVGLGRTVRDKFSHQDTASLYFSSSGVPTFFCFQ